MIVRDNKIAINTHLCLHSFLVQLELLVVLFELRALAFGGRVFLFEGRGEILEAVLLGLETRHRVLDEREILLFASNLDLREESKWKSILSFLIIKIKLLWISQKLYITWGYFQ